MLSVDIETVFTAKFFQDVCRLLNIHSSFTTNYYPQTNGQIERFNLTLKAAIQSYFDYHWTDLDLYTPSLTSVYDSLPHTPTA